MDDSDLVKQQFNELLELSTICKNHKVSEDFYAAPGFMEFLDGTLTLDDIPMEYNKVKKDRNIAEKPEDYPWEDNIKNLIFDTTSTPSNRKYSTCIILTGYQYNYIALAIYMIKYRYKISSIIYVSPTDDTCESFEIIVQHSNKIEMTETVSKDYVVSSTTIWYAPKNTLVLCHTTDIPEYMESIIMMPSSTWSISCSNGAYIKHDDNNIKCSYICPVYSHRASTETRAVGTGLVKLQSYIDNASYIGSINYYSRFIRGSRYSSGRCYDCQVIYNILSKLSIFKGKEVGNSLPIFDSAFLMSAKEVNEQV